MILKHDMKRGMYYNIWEEVADVGGAHNNDSWILCCHVAGFCIDRGLKEPHDQDEEGSVHDTTRANLTTQCVHGNYNATTLYHGVRVGGCGEMRVDMLSGNENLRGQELTRRLRR